MPLTGTPPGANADPTTKNSAPTFGIPESTTTPGGRFSERNGHIAFSLKSRDRWENGTNAITETPK
jgi:hypothetical protein